MRLGLSSYACPWEIGVPGYDAPKPALDAPRLIERANSLGLDLVQIADNLPLERASAGEIDRIRRRARSHNIGVELGTRGIEPNHVRRYLDLCQSLEASILRVVVDTPVHRPSPDEIAAIVRALLPDLHRASVTLAIENHDRFPVAVLAEIVAVIADRNVGICLDTANSFGSGEGPREALAALAPHVVNLHIKDFVIKREPHNLGFKITGAPAGAGMLDIPWLLSALREASRDPNAILEHWPEPEASLAETVAKEREWCVESVRNLRTLVPR